MKQLQFLADLVAGIKRELPDVILTFALGLALMMAISPDGHYQTAAKIATVIVIAPFVIMLRPRERSACLRDKSRNVV